MGHVTHLFGKSAQPKTMKKPKNKGKKLTPTERSIIQGYVMLLMAILYRG